MTLLWFVVWFVSNLIGDKEPLIFNPRELVGGLPSIGDRGRPEQVVRDQARVGLNGGLSLVTACTGSKLVTLFFPVVGVVVVAVALPEAGLVRRHRLEGARPPG